MSDIVEYSVDTFDSIKHVNEEGQEFWYARELQKVLEYTKWENFVNVIDKAKEGGCGRFLGPHPANPRLLR